MDLGVETSGVGIDEKDLRGNAAEKESIGTSGANRARTDDGDSTRSGEDMATFECAE